MEDLFSENRKNAIADKMYRETLSGKPEPYLPPSETIGEFVKTEFDKIKKSDKRVIKYNDGTYRIVEIEKCILSCDPGTNGAFAIITASGKSLTHKMPDTPKDLFELLKSIKNEYEVDCILEKVGGLPGMGGSPMFNFGQGYGHIEMALIALEIPTTTVSPQKWQKSLLIGTKSKQSTTEWKNKLKGKAQQLFPYLKVTLGNADALLIAYYYKNL